MCRHTIQSSGAPGKSGGADRVTRHHGSHLADGVVAWPGAHRIRAQRLIDERSNPWGTTVQSEEMRDVVIPVALQDAMSRAAQAAWEKAARVILGEAKQDIAHLFWEAASSGQENPTALHLSAMTMFYEGLNHCRLKPIDSDRD